MPSHQRKSFVSFVREVFAGKQTYAPYTTQTHMHEYNMNEYVT